MGPGDIRLSGFKHRNLSITPSLSAASQSVSTHSPLQYTIEFSQRSSSNRMTEGLLTRLWWEAVSRFGAGIEGAPAHPSYWRTAWQGDGLGESD